MYRPQYKTYTPKFRWPILLAHPNIPKPLHGLNPRTILGDKWWDGQRQLAYAKNNYCCWACGVSKDDAKYHQWLEAHECYNIDYAHGRAEMVMVSALCHLCHNYIHSGRMQMMLDKNEITQEFYDEVIDHGHNVLISAEDVPSELKFLGNMIFTQLNDESVKWSDWRLVLNGKEYEPIYKSRLDWLRAYS